MSTQEAVTETQHERRRGSMPRMQNLLRPVACGGRGLYTCLTGDRRVSAMTNVTLVQQPDVSYSSAHRACRRVAMRDARLRTVPGAISDHRTGHDRRCTATGRTRYAVFFLRGCLPLECPAACT